MGITEAIVDGSASESELLSYYNRIIEPICTVIVSEFKRKWLSQTAITQGQSIIYFKDPFKLVPVSQIAEIADKFTRNEIVSSNEIRSVIGMRPSSDPKADELRNKNLNSTETEATGLQGSETLTDAEYQQALTALDELDSQIDSFSSEIGGG